MGRPPDRRMEAEICLVTGGSRGIGASVVRRLAAPHRVVYLNHRDSSARAAEVVAAVSPECAVEVVQADLAIEADVAAMMDRVQESHGILDVLVHCAAAPMTMRRIPKLNWERDVAGQIDVACRGFLFCLRHAWTLLAPRARIVAVMTEHFFQPPPVRVGGYLISKGALWGLLRSAAKELASAGVVVSAVSPGMTDTEMLAVHEPRALELIAHDLPGGRFLTPAEVAEVVVTEVEAPWAPPGGDIRQVEVVAADGGSEG